jgi:hypothetical protein
MSPPSLMELAVVGRCRGNGCPAQVPRSCPAGRMGCGSPRPWPVAVPGTHRSVIGRGLVGSSHHAILWSRACHTFPSPHLWPWAHPPTPSAAGWCRVTFFYGLRAGAGTSTIFLAQRLAHHGHGRTPPRRTNTDQRNDQLFATRIQVLAST